MRYISYTKIFFLTWNFSGIKIAILETYDKNNNTFNRRWRLNYWCHVLKILRILVPLDPSLSTLSFSGLWRMILANGSQIVPRSL